MNKYLISDTHFGHQNIIEYENRPFKDANEMDDYMINKWNSVVNNGDLVYHLGDFFLTYTDRQMEIFNKLNGDIILIKGNHDRQSDTKLIERIGFKSVHDELILHHRGLKILLTHEPKEQDYLSDNSIDFNIHGHQHTLENQVSFKHINVSVENIEYTPITIKKVIEDNWL